MADPTRRHSRYPAVNRDVPAAPTPAEASVAPVEAPVELEAPQTVEIPTEAPEAPQEVVEEAVEEETETVELPDLIEMSTKEVLAWVGNDDSRRTWAITSEAAGRGRKGLLKKLQDD